jgi:hypothetical protein
MLCCRMCGNDEKRAALVQSTVRVAAVCVECVRLMNAAAACKSTVEGFKYVPQRKVPVSDEAAQ